MDKNKRNFYIDLIEFGLEKGHKGIDRNEVYDFLSRKGYIAEEAVIRMRENRMVAADDDIENTIHLLLLGVFEHRNSRYFLNFEGMFKWLEYAELVEARNNSKDAKRHSYIAIFLSVLALFASIVFGIYENWQPASIQRVIEPIKIDMSVFHGDEHAGK